MSMNRSLAVAALIAAPAALAAKVVAPCPAPEKSIRKGEFDQRCAPQEGRCAEGRAVAQGRGGPTCAPCLGGSCRGGLRIAVIGDIDEAGQRLATERVAALVHHYAADHILTLGDNLYPKHGSKGYARSIGTFYSSYIAGKRGHEGENRFWPSPGNHDYELSKPRALTEYFKYFSKVGDNYAACVREPDKCLPAYEARLGSLRVISINSGYHCNSGPRDEKNPLCKPTAPDDWLRDPSGRQGQWLKARLAAGPACFNLVFFHHPPHDSGCWEVPSMRWPFKEWGMDVVLAGHEHFYERLSDGDLRYFVVGTAGAKVHHFRNHRYVQTDYRNAHKNCDRKQPAAATRSPHSKAQIAGEHGALFLELREGELSFHFVAIDRDAQGRIRYRERDRDAIRKTCAP